MTPDVQELPALERAGWDALAAGGATAATFYEDVLAADATFVFPGGWVLDDRTSIIESMGGPPWDEYVLSDEQVVAIGADVAAIVYRADARRGADRYQAVCTSTYVHRAGRWRLRMHQQTP